jgi:Protein of unknown function (DUF1236)
MRSTLNKLSVALCTTLLCCSAAYAQTAVRLSSASRAAIWRSLGKDATDTSVAAGLRVGEAVPAPMRLLRFNRHVRKRVPTTRFYSYALVQGQVLIVDPRNRKIVAVISK